MPPCVGDGEGVEEECGFGGVEPLKDGDAEGGCAVGDEVVGAVVFGADVSMEGTEVSVRLVHM